MSYYHYYQQEAVWDSDYDSTWEDEVPDPPKKKRSQNPSNRAARDMQNYRHGYGQTGSFKVQQRYMPNLAFYQNNIEFQPYGVKIEEFHQEWRENYKNLEENHNFIQWLFPLREPGVNSRATPLTLAEIQMMKEDPEVRRRFLESYEIMLGFYGIHLLDKNTGEVSRATNWEERFGNLNNHTHNNLRITRILKCLGEMGYEHLQAPLVRFFLEETLCHNNLPNVEGSVLDYFMFTVKDKQERRKLVHFAWKNYRSQEQFIWGPKEKLQNFTTKEEEEEKGKEKPEEENSAQKPERAAGDRDVDNSSGNEEQPTESNSSGTGDLKREDTNIKNEELITEDKISVIDIQKGRDLGEGLTTADNRAVNRQSAENIGFIAHKTPADASLQLKLITEDISFGKEHIMVGTSLENTQLTSPGEPESPKNEEGQKLLRVNASKETAVTGQRSLLQEIFSLCGFCCYFCCFKHLCDSKCCK